MKKLILINSLAFALGFGSQAATNTVTNLDDSGPGSLRDSIASAAAGDIIDFQTNGTIVLTSGELVVDKDLTIAGPGAKVLAISGGFASRVLSISSNVTSSISGLTVTKGQVNSTSLGAGILNQGNLTLTACAVTANTNINVGPVADGGGILNQFPGNLALVNCTISGNAADYGAGVYNYQNATGTVTQCTLSGNTANFSGGGILNWGTLSVDFVTLANNQGTGMHTLDAPLTYQNTLFASNQPVNIGGTGTASLGHNLSSDGSGSLTGPGDLPNTVPHLGPLADNGGQTLTHAILPGSRAIDHGSSGGSGLATDQRGQPRNFNFPAYVDAGDGSDIGAYELQESAQPGPVFTVNTTDDLNDGVPGIAHCSLREAINAANANANLNTIDFATEIPGVQTGVTGTITLLQGEILIDQSVNINGPGQANLTLDGHGASRIFVARPGSVVHVSDLTIANGLAKGEDGLASPDNPASGGGGGGGAAGLGGGMYVWGANVTLSRVLMTGNTARGGNGGPSGVSTNEFGTGGNGGNGSPGIEGGPGGAGGINGGTGGAGAFCSGGGGGAASMNAPGKGGQGGDIGGGGGGGGGGFGLKTTTNSWDGSAAIGEFGESRTGTYGQTFTVSNKTVMSSFTLYLNNTAGTNYFAFYVMAWDGAKATGPVLYASPATNTAGRVGMQPYTFDLGNLQLSSNTYVAFISATLFFDGIEDAATQGLTATDVYSGGGFFFQNADATFTSLTNSPWDASYANRDAAFYFVTVGALGGGGGLFGGGGQDACENNAGGGGGGGAGLGGAVFVENGSLTLNNSTLTNNSAIGGLAGASGCDGQNGQGKGGAIFNLGGTSSGTVVLANNTASDGGITLTDNDCVYGAFTAVALIADPTGGQPVPVTNAPISLANAGSPPGGTYSGNGIVGNTFDPAVAQVGNSTITYTVTNECGLNASTNLTITVDCVDAITVTQSGDDGAWSLRWALRNLCPDGGTVSIAVTNPIIVSTTNDNNVGPSAFGIVERSVTIEGNGATIQRDPNVPNLRFFYNSGYLLLNNLTLRDGIALGLANSSPEPSVIGGAPDGMGGAIFNEGGLDLQNSTLAGNQAIGADDTNSINGGSGLGGAIFNAGWFIGIYESTLSSNTAQGGSSLSGSGGNGIGGGLFNIGGDDGMSIVNSTFSGNSAQGGDSDSATGGSARGGGVYHGNAYAFIVNNTFAYNTVAAGTGGTPPLADGGALYNDDGGFIYLLNTILAYSGGANDAINAGDPSNVTGDHNLAERYSGFGNVFIGVTPNPKLGSLQNNGGPTFTHALLAGSAAIDTGNNSVNAPPADQRGVTRGIVDIGAFEAHPWLSVIPPSTTAEDTQVAVNFTLGDPLLLATNPVTITAVCSDPGLVPAAGLSITNTGTSRTLVIMPATNANGTATITVTATTTNGSMSSAFALTVNPVNDPPTLALIPDLFITDNAGQQTVNLSGITSGPTNESQVLTVTATSSNPGLIPGVLVNYVSPQTVGTLSFASLPDAFGDAVITVTVNDGGAANNVVMQTFTVHVNARPRVTITQPANNAVFVVPQAIGIVANGSDADGTVASVDIYAGTNLLGSAAGGLFTWSGAAPGVYDLTAVATDNLDATGTSAVVRVTVQLHAQIASVSAVDTTSARVRQTGLFYQTVCVSNTTPLTFAAARVSVGNLPDAVRLHNATGTNAGLPFVQYNQTILPNSTVCLELEYYASDRKTVPNATFIADLVNPVTPPDPGTNAVTLAIKEVQPDGTVVLIFKTIANRTYYVQYRNGTNTTWTTAVPGILGNGSHIPWIDSGPPKTESHPSTVPSRFYQLILTP